MSKGLSWENLSDNAIHSLSEQVKAISYGEESGHDWWHVYRVWKMSKAIAEKEGADARLASLIALVHDVDDWKFSDNFEMTRGILRNVGLSAQQLDFVINEVKKISFKGAGILNKPDSLEGRVVQDADRLDALGAIGIARCFATGAKLGRLIYDGSKPVMRSSFDEYKNTKGSSINHFYEKLLLLKDRMNTKTARRIAEHRHRFMEEFLDEFFKEIEGKA